MKLPAKVIRFLQQRGQHIAASRDPDFVIGTPDNPYLLRWFVIPRNWIFNVYLHNFRRSDDDRALHDHPWLNLSILLDGEYVEHTIPAGGVNHRTRYAAGNLKFRGARSAHRVELNAGPCWTLFITGPRIREWGFHCPLGWKQWREFTRSGSPGEIGPGCDDPRPLPRLVRDRYDGASADDLERERAAWLGNSPPLAHGKLRHEQGGASV